MARLLKRNLELFKGAKAMIKVKEKSISKYALYAMFAIVILLMWFSLPESNGIPRRRKAMVLFLIYTFYLVTWIKFTGRWKSLFFFFYCYSMMTNAGQLFLYAFGIEIISSANIFKEFSAHYIEKAMDYQILCTVLMTTFALFANEKFIKNKQDFHVKQTEAEEKSNKVLSIWDIVYLVSAFLVFAFNILRLGSRVDSKYLDAFTSGDASAAPFLVTFVFYISMYYACFAHRKKGDSFKKYIIIVNVFVGISSLLFGSRNVLIPLIFGMLFTWDIGAKKLTFKKKALVILLALLVLYLLSSFVNLRQKSLSEITFTVIIDSLFGTGFFEQIVIFISEMGGSLRVLTTTMYAMDLGTIQSEQTFLYTILKGIVPQAELLNILGISEPTRWCLSLWITERYGDLAGWGYSMYAEAFYNFKNYGFIFMALFGFGYVWLESKIQKWYLSGRSIIASAWLFVATYVIFLARADSLLIMTRLRYVIYLSLGCELIRVFGTAPAGRKKHKYIKK